VVTHAGHGTICAALAQGLPLVAMPNAMADQAALAARLEALGAGLALAGDATPDQIRSAVERVTSESDFGYGARRLQHAIQSAPSAAGAAGELELLARATSSHIR
jgi:UDP:flavonoid glycosyltransferase YjiC (YdhE family)